MKKQSNYHLKDVWADPYWRFRIIFFFIWVIGFILFLIWLNNHPEYTSYDPSSVMEISGGELAYLKRDCSQSPYAPFGKVEDCTFTITEPPPAYWIDKWYVKYRSYIFWLGSIYILFWCISNRKLIYDWLVFLQELVNEHDKKPKNRRNRK